MTQEHFSKKDGATEKQEDSTGESSDLQAIKRDAERRQFALQLWEKIAPPVDEFAKDLEMVALAANDWSRSSLRRRVRALLILARRLGVPETHFLTKLAEDKAAVRLRLVLRHRSDAEKLDGGKREKEQEQDYLDFLMGMEVYSRMKGGATKQKAIDAATRDYRSGSGAFANLDKSGRSLPEYDGIEKWLNRFRKKAYERGYIDPFAASTLSSLLGEPELKISDIPKRGRPRNK